MNQQIRLETADGQVIGSASIPHFDSPPTVLLWGKRGFKWIPDLKQALPSETPLIYREVPLVFVLTSIKTGE